MVNAATNFCHSGTAEKLDTPLLVSRVLPSLLALALPVGLTWTYRVPNVEVQTAAL